METPSPQIPRSEKPPPSELPKEGPNILQLNLENPNWRGDAKLGPKIAAIQSAITGINAACIVATEFANNNPEANPKKQKLTELGKTVRELSRINSITVSAISLSRLANPNRVPGFIGLKLMAETIYGREISDEENDVGRVKYPPGTNFTNIFLHSPGEVEAVHHNLTTLMHEFRTPLAASVNLLDSIETNSKASIAQRLSLGSEDAVMSLVSEADINDIDLAQLETRFKDIRGIAQDTAVELLTNSNPQEHLNALDFYERFTLRLRSDFPLEVLQNPTFIVNYEGKLWLDELAKKIQSESKPETELISEILSISSAFEAMQSPNQDQSELRMAISPQLMQHFQFTWGLGKMKMVADNAVQNLLKAFDITPANKSTVDYTQVKITPTFTIAPDGTVELGIEDNGKGLPPDFQGIKEDYTNWGGDTTKGTGKGLKAQEDNIQEYYNGRLELRPNPTGGAILIASLPRRSVSETVI